MMIQWIQKFLTNFNDHSGLSDSDAKKEVVDDWTYSGWSICLVNSLNWYQLSLVW